MGDVVVHGLTMVAFHFIARILLVNKTTDIEMRFVIHNDSLVKSGVVFQSVYDGIIEVTTAFVDPRFKYLS